jgi:hypothetical protein
MTTLAELSLQIAKIVMPEHILNGTATDGSATYLKDIYGMTQQNGYFDRGILWIRSGTHSGKAVDVRRHALNKVTFDSLGTVICVQQVETATVVGTIGPAGAGNATVIVTASGMTGSPKTLSVAVANNDTASQVATKIRTAMNADTDITNFFTVGGSGAAVSLTTKVARANDTTLNISIANGTCTGLTAAPTSANTTAGVAGPRYSVSRNVYPYSQIKSAIMEALDETYIEDEDDSLTGDGETHEFPLPAGVSDIKRVEIENTSFTGYQPISTHWKERGGNLKFDYGYAPYEGASIHIFYRTSHSEPTDYDDTIDTEIDIKWLAYKAAEKLLLWAVGQYGENKEYRIEERLNIVISNLKGKFPRLEGPDIELTTAAGS